MTNEDTDRIRGMYSRIELTMCWAELESLISRQLTVKKDPRTGHLSGRLAPRHINGHVTVSVLAERALCDGGPSRAAFRRADIRKARDLVQVALGDHQSVVRS